MLPRRTRKPSLKVKENQAFEEEEMRIQTELEAEKKKNAKVRKQKKAQK